MTPGIHTACLALGSNLGDRAGLIRGALERLAGRGVVVEAVSTLLETEPVGGPPLQGRYLNGAALVRTALPPRALLRLLLEVERELGRARLPGQSAAPRTIDLDLLLYDDAVIQEPDLCVPHPRLHLRRFVLAPLAEIAPGVRHPVLKRTVGELLAELGTRNSESRMQERTKKAESGKQKAE